jgi:hypothetical protein
MGVKVEVVMPPPVICVGRLSMGDLDPDFVDQIPGKLQDRKTALGELNWIFTAITDTIAWNTLPSSLFQRLFRQVTPG